ncbi:glycosyltransferase family 39 protein [Streptomyces sp. NPDC049577]|uniref:ArnT family glycosyltransferase n=1 Tax=Streptomyces sp. NPDC049577 TaxID=3155153 RepID=UPI0034180165
MNRIPEQRAGHGAEHDDAYYGLGWTGGQVTGPEQQSYDEFDEYDRQWQGQPQGRPLPHAQWFGAGPGQPHDTPHEHTSAPAEPYAAEQYTAEPYAGTEAGAEGADEPGYRIPPTPDAGWDMADSRRRGWVSRAVLLCVLVVQAVLSLRLANTAFQDEALALYTGHVELDHLLHGTALPDGYDRHFSGSPVLYPVLAAFVESSLGLAGARALSLVLTLGTTALLYSFTRRMFNERVALLASAMFAVTQSTIVLGNLATYDAAAGFLLAVAAWIVVRTGRAPLFAVLLAAPVAALAVAVKYGAVLYVPTLLVLAVLTAWPHHRGRSALRGLLLFLGVAALAGGWLFATGTLTAVQDTVLVQPHGIDGVTDLLKRFGAWSGLLFLTSCLGAVSYVRRGRMNESPRSLELTGPGWRWRALIGLLLCGTALIAPACQMYVGDGESLYKHVGLGLLFAAPMAGIGVSRLVGAHFRYPQLGIMLWVGMLCMGIAQSDWRFGVWPDSTHLVQALRPQVDGKGRYLSSAREVPLYYLRDRTSPGQWTSTSEISYKDPAGTVHTGKDGYRRALADGWFDIVVLDGLHTSTGEDLLIATELRSNPHYRLSATVPFKTSSGTGVYRIWTRR